MDKLPEIRNKKDYPIYQDVRVVVMKPLKEDISLKKTSFLEPIREDQDDEYLKYNDDFDHEDVRVIKKPIINRQLLDINQNIKSAEPHLYKSKIHNLQPLNEQ